MNSVDINPPVHATVFDGRQKDREEKEAPGSLPRAKVSLGTIMNGRPVGMAPWGAVCGAR